MLALPSPTAEKLPFWMYSPVRQERLNSATREVRIEHVSALQKWIEQRCGVRPSLLVEYVEELGRNRVLLRLERDGLSVIAEVKMVRALFQKQRRASAQLIFALFSVPESA